MAPEQAHERPLGPYTDLYALGVIAYELLAGRPPFELRHAGRGAVLPRPPAAAAARRSSSQPDVTPRVRELGRVAARQGSGRRARSRPRRHGTRSRRSPSPSSGPYWRRTATITPGAHQPAPTPARNRAATRARRAGRRRRTDAPAPHPERAAGPGARGRRASSPPPALPRQRWSRRAPRRLSAMTDEPGRKPPPPVRAERSATPYDFDGDGGQELVLGMPRGSPRGRSTRSGVVLVQQRAARAVAPRQRDHAPAAARAAARQRRLSARARERGLRPATARRISRSARPGGSTSPCSTARRGQLDGAAHSSSRRGRSGCRRARAGTATARGARLERGRLDDLVVGAPGSAGHARHRAPCTGLRRAGGLQTDRPRTIRRPDDTYVEFGSRLRAGDIDGDGNLDLVEGPRPAGPARPGTPSYCRGRRTGRPRCRPLGVRRRARRASRSPTSTATITTTSSRATPSRRRRTPVSAGRVRVWRGGRRGPRATPLTITQDTRSSRASEPGDQFGAVVETGDLDADGFADMIVAAWARTRRRGGHRHPRPPQGHARNGNTAFDQD